MKTGMAFARRNAVTSTRTSLALAVIAALGCGAALGASAATSVNPSPVVAHATTLERGDALIGALPMTQSIHVVIALKLRNRDVLDAFIANAAKNRVGGVEQPLSREQYFANHAPSQAQAQAVADFLTSRGFSNVVIASNRLLVTADGSALTAGNAFQTSFAQIRTHDGRIAFANTGDAHVPLALQDSVLSVVGLQTVHVPLAPKPAKAMQSETGQGYNPLKYPSIYRATSVATGAGVTVGIITQGNIAQTITDLNTFAANNLLGTISTQTVNTGGTSTVASYIDEWDIDSQDALGMAGGQVGKIVFYNMPDWTDPDMVADFNTAVADNQAKIINASIQDCESNVQGDGSLAAADQIFALADAQGQTFSVATGDYGSAICGTGTIAASWPSNSPYVVAVGGTSLNTSDSESTWDGETVWAASGGAPSLIEPKPSWQGALVPGSMRGVPDVVFDGDPNTGAEIVYMGQPAQYGGTSLSAPIFTGMWARVIAAKGINVGFAGPILYALPTTAFHDITVGSNGGEKAGVGYDFASGRGSIVLGSAINHIEIGNLPPTADFSFTTSGLTAAFTDESSGGDSPITSYAWTFGDGTTSTVASPSHFYTSAGKYNAVETVTNADGKSDSKTASVTVSNAGGTQLLRNTGFESGAEAPWNMTFDDLQDNPALAHSGNWFAEIGNGGAGAHTDHVTQSVAIPSGRTSAVLAFFLHTITAETTTTKTPDDLYVRVYGSTGTLLATLATYSNLSASSGYVQHNLNMTPYIGQTVQVDFVGVNNATLETTWDLDNVTLTEH